MTHAHLTLDILTPTGAIQRGLVVAGVEVPGLHGELGVLPHHVAFVAPLRPGIVRFKAGDISVRMAVGAGFVEVSDDGRVAILCERALSPDRVDIATARKELERVQAELAARVRGVDDTETALLTSERDWLDAQIRLTSQ